MKFTIDGSDIVAIVLLIGSFGLRALGINSLTEYIILGVAIAYGAVKIPRPGDKDKSGS